MSSPNAPSPAKVIASRKSTRRPHRVTLHLSDETMATLEREMATSGYSDADALIERLLREHKGRRAREEKLRREAEQVVTTASGRRVRVQQMRTRMPSFTVKAIKSEDGVVQEPIGIPFSQGRELFRTESQVRSPACEVSVHELRNTGGTARLLLLQNFYNDLDGISRLNEHFVLNRTSIPWLIDVLQQADSAIEAESSRNRKKALDVRASRSSEEAADERETKRTYTERYSKERVSWATTLATRHRSRAQHIDLKDHFTAWEWLDLCAQTEFRCASCGALTNLEPHHCKDLSAGGANTIDNIEPLCRHCHRGLPLEPREAAELWAYQQQQLIDAFQVGDVVRLNHRMAKPRTISQLFPAQPGRDVPERYYGSIIRFDGADAKDWITAKACLTWQSGHTLRKQIVDLEKLVKVDEV